MFNKITHAIVHPIYRNIEHPNYKKVVIYSNTLLLCAISIIIYSTYFLSKYPLDTKNISNILGCLDVLISIILLRVFSDFRISLAFIILGSFPLVVMGVYLTGGIYSSNLIWFIILANSAFFNVNRKVGIFYAVCCFIVYILFYYLSFNPENDKLFTQFIFIHHSLDNFFNICFASAFSFLLVYSFAKTVDEANKKIKKVNDEKVESLNLKIKEKTNEISALRSSLAKDFHDEMGNKLAGISVLSQMLAKKFNDKFDNETIVALETIQTRSNELLLGTKDFIWSIDVKSDYVTHLGLFIRNFGEDFFSKLNISFSYQSEISEDSTLRVNVSSGRQIVNIFKEAMTNVAKHADANEVSFVISINKNTIVFTMKDNGKGFEIEKVSKNGIFNMKDRTEQIKSKISIVSEHNKGTRIELHVPLEN
ncbi:MAG: hypothetical protein EAZ53_01805 [Bacteroidetes bacterium]|nr:MAG: hypothetical protein EAZ53_01805 [Bacteroidota bacterium]